MNAAQKDFLDYWTTTLLLLNFNTTSTASYETSLTT
jgi:hypothetical protein